MSKLKTGLTYDEVNSRETAKDYLFSAAVLERTRKLYVERNLTVRQTIEEMSLSHYYEGNKGYFARAFSYHLPKETGEKGGARKGSGRPRGSRSCTGCGRLRTECECPPLAEQDRADQILTVVARPSGAEDGTYTAAVAVEHRPGYYRAYERQVHRYPPHGDVQKTINGGGEMSPARARETFGSLLTDHQLEN